MRVPAAASLSSCASPGRPFLSHQPRDSALPGTSRWTVLFQAPAAGQCSSRHQPRDSALPGTGILHLLLSRARKVLSSFLRYGNPLRPPDLITPLCAGAHALQSPFTGCEAETVSNACLAILPQQGLPVVQLPHL